MLKLSSSYLCVVPRDASMYSSLIFDFFVNTTDTLRHLERSGYRFLTLP